MTTPRTEQPARRAAAGRIGLIVLTSMAAGLLAAGLLVAVPVLPAREDVLTGAVLLAFALGWGLLGLLSVRSQSPQRWALAPAALLGLFGVAVLSGSPAVHTVLGWVWPPTLLALVVWMLGRARRQVPGRSRRWLVYPVLAVLGLASVAGGYETVRETLDARSYPMPGRLVDVGGHRLHLSCTGSGSPTVVLEPGLGGASPDLAWIAPVVARDTRVCVYDRAGRGWSEPTDGPQDGAQVAADLHTLLDRAGVPGPYVLAGHSFGGLYVLSFAAQFPDQVAGLVLLDSTAPKPGPAPQPSPGGRPGTVVDRVGAVLPALAHLGAGRLLALGSYSTLPPRARAEARAGASTARHLASQVREFLAGSSSVRQAASLTDLDGKPLIVLTADTGHDDAWRAAQAQLATLSSNREHRAARDTTHESLVYDQADSAAASRAVHDVVLAVRSSRPLGGR